MPANVAVIVSLPDRGSTKGGETQWEVSKI